jgi:hypothetical protein
MRSNGDHPLRPVRLHPFAGMAKQLDITFTKSNYGQAQLSPSIFLQELGKAAPKPVGGKAWP